MFERITSLVVNDKGEYSKIHVFAFALAGLHVCALILWLVLIARQRPPSLRELDDRVRASKDEKDE